MPYKKRKQKCKQSDGTPGRYVLSYTTKKGKKRKSCHTSKDKMQGMIAAIEAESVENDGELMSEDEIRKIIRAALLYESTAPEREVTSAIYQSILDSKFWEMAHNESDVDLVDSATFSTPAIEILMDALNGASDMLGSDLYFILSVTDDENYTLGPDDEYGGYPNNWMMRGQYRGPERGKHIIWLEFRPYSDEYKIEDLDYDELSKIISRTINHELVHYNQLKKQAQSKNISEEEAWEQLTKDSKQISRSGSQEDYISLHNEIDAFAYEAAEELLDKYSPEEALDQLRSGRSDSPGIVSRYISTLKNDRPSLERFLSKVYTNIKRISTETGNLQEKKKRKKKKSPVAGYHPEESYVQGTVKNLYLDREIKALPNLSIRKNGKEVPVNVQIRDYLRSMKMIPESVVEKIYLRIISESESD